MHAIHRSVVKGSFSDIRFVRTFVRFSSSYCQELSIPSTASLPVQIRGPRVAQYKKPRDVVSQIVSLTRTSAPLTIWREVGDVVIHHIPRMNGEDLATIIKSVSIVGYRDEILLVATCEAIRYLIPLGAISVCNIATILDGFHRLNFIPSVDILNLLGDTISDHIVLYKSRPIDLCIIYRYFAIMKSRQEIFEKLHHRIFLNLNKIVNDRIGNFGAIEISIIAKYSTHLGIRQLIENFSRSENTNPKVHAFFIRQLEVRFGKNSWHQFYYLFRPNIPIDSTGWNRSVDDDSDEESFWSITATRPARTDFPLFQMRDDNVANVLSELKNFCVQQRPEIRPKRVIPQKIDHQICDSQLEALALMEEEVGLERRQSFIRYHDRLCKKEKYIIERRDYKRKKCSKNSKRLKIFKRFRNKQLMKFSFLASLRKHNS